MTVAAPASALIIFEDDFNRARTNNVGNGWTELEDDNNDVAIRNYRLRLRDTLPGNPDAAASQLGGLSTVGLTNIFLSYNWSASRDTEAADDLFVEWKPQSDATWNRLAAHNLGRRAGGFNSVGLGIGAEGKSGLQIRFWTDVSWRTEAAYIDNVKLKGIRGVAVSISEPATLMLAAFGFGLVGLGAAFRRRQ